MKKQLTTLLAVGVMATTMGSTSAQAATETANPTPISSSGWLHSDESQRGAFKNTYYRLKAKTPAKLAAYRAQGGAMIQRKLTLPKGTIISATKQGKYLVKTENSQAADVRYGLKAATLKKMGTVGQGTLVLKIKASQATKIKRPVYALPYGGGQLLSGGLKALSQVPKITSNQIRITADGYLEYYPNHPHVVTGDGGYQWTYAFNQRPTKSVKITKATAKGSRVFLYTKVKPAGVASSRVAKTGAHQYRVKLTNLHTPYAYTDNWLGDDTGVASLYTIGKTTAYTVIGEGFN